MKRSIISFFKFQRFALTNPRTETTDDADRAGEGVMQTSASRRTTYLALVKITVIQFLLVSLNTPFLSGQGNESLRGRLDDILNNYHREGRLNGTVLIAEQNSVRYLRSFGYSDLETREMLNDSSVYCIASVSKIFTGAAIMLLEEDGLLDIDDPVNKYLTSLPEIYSRVTVRDLMSHTSGITEMNNDWKSMAGMKNIDIYNFLIGQDSIDSDPGTRYRYSKTGFNLLAVLIDSLSSSSYGEFIRKRIFDDLGMKQSFIRSEKIHRPNVQIVKSYINGQQADWPLYTYGAGGIYCTAKDLFTWDSAFFNGKVIGRDHMTEVLKRTENKDGSLNFYGLGWGVFKSGSMTSVGHTGGMFGFRALYERIIENGVTIIILTNIGDATPVMEIRTAILQAMAR